MPLYQQGIPWHLEDLILPYYLIFLSQQLLQGFLRAVRAKGNEKVNENIIKVCKYLNNNVSIHPIKYYGASRKVFNFKDLNQIKRQGR